MPNWELQLITAVLRSECPPAAYEETIRLGVDSDTFGGTEARALWGEIKMHYNRPNNFGYVPSIETLMERWPNTDFPTPLENHKDLCGKIVEANMGRKTRGLIDKFHEQVEAEDALKASASLYTSLGQLQERSVANADMSFRKSARRGVAEDQEKIKNSNGITGMPWPWDKMNEATQGIQQGDLIMFWALPKSMKTWVGLVVCAHLYKSGYRVLVYSKEMSWKVVRNRICCIVAELDYTRFKNGELDAAESRCMDRTFDLLEAEDFPGDLDFTQADRPDGSPGGPVEIQRKIEVYKPHFVMLDSAYMLEIPDQSGSALDWKALSMVNRQLKQICKSTGVPMLAILQESERAALKYKNSRGTASLAMNTLAVADCDVGGRLIHNKKAREISLQLSAARETTVEGFTIFAEAATNFTYKSDHIWDLHEVNEQAEESNKTAKAAVVEEAAAQIRTPLMDREQGALAAVQAALTEAAGPTEALGELVEDLDLATFATPIRDTSNEDDEDLDE